MVFSDVSVAPFIGYILAFGAFVEPFMSAPSPGILAMAVRNEYYDTLEAYLAALGAAAFVPHGRAAPRTHGQRSKPA